MKECVLKIIAFRNRILPLYLSADRFIDSIALSFFSRSHSDFHDIISYIDKKEALINLKLFLDSFANALDPSHLELLQLYASGCSVSELATKFSLPKHSIAKILDYAIRKCARSLAKLGFDQQRISAEYKFLFF